MMGESWPWLIWSTLRGWMSPAVLFLLLNLVIGTIALTSKSLRSHLNRRDTGDLHPHPEHFAPPIARGPSAVLERVRSIGLFRFRSGDLPFDQVFPAREEDDNDDEEEEEEEEELTTSPSVAVASNALQGVALDHDEHEYSRSRSDSGQPAGQKLAGRMKKSASMSSAFAHFDAADTGGRRPVRGGGREVVMDEEEEEEEKEGEGLNARADDFINRFRQQLKLQRLDSILRYKDMLNRGK